LKVLHIEIAFPATVISKSNSRRRIHHRGGIPFWLRPCVSNRNGAMRNDIAHGGTSNERGHLSGASFPLPVLTLMESSFEKSEPQRLNQAALLLFCYGHERSE
jgi:hypothetical protein